MKRIALVLAAVFLQQTLVAGWEAGAEEMSPGSQPAGSGHAVNTSSSFAALLSEGKAYLDERYRFEYVEQDRTPRNAKASTLRSRFGFLSGQANHLKFKLEIEDVTVVGNDTYNSTVNDRTDYAVVADPDGTEVNEAWVDFSLIPETSIRAGREALKLDNLRFVGDVGWRQNNQTFDGLNVSNTSLPDTELFYGFVGHVNRIFGENSPVGDFSSALHLFRAQYRGFAFLTITPYVYLFDVDDAEQVSSSNFGLRVNGTTPLTTSSSLLYDLEYAYQEDYSDNPQDYSAKYYRLSVGARRKGISVVGGYEVLGSDDGNVGFSTPFATLHKWNGWADTFLNTPDDGLQDAYASLHYEVAELHTYLESLAADVVYHYFAADEGNSKFGDEWDFSILAKINSYVSLHAKYALYNSANFARDTEKLIFTAHVKLSQ